MRFKSVYLKTLCMVTLFIVLNGLGLRTAFAAPNIKHSHNGRVHSHILPKTGVKHYHKHLHNGRAHIHPYSEKVGFNHTHNKNASAKTKTNSVKHKHSDRVHSHPLPPSGIKHPHKHRHGSRIHSHLLPVSGQKHFHRVNNKRQNKPNPPMITGLSIKQQIDAVLKTTPLQATKNRPINKPSKSIFNPSKPQKMLSVMNQKTIDKVLGKHSHKGRIHQHSKPASGQKHTHNKVVNSVKKHNIKKRQPPKLASINSASHTKKNIAKPIKTKPIQTKVIKPAPRAVKQTPKQKADSNRQFTLALRYENGTGVVKNLPQAFNWYQRAAKQGNAKAQYKLGLLFEKGTGVARNIPQAIRWYIAAGNNGNTNAQVMLGNKYAEGSNVPRDINKAKKWYRMAANQGDLRGRANLNYLIEE